MTVHGECGQEGTKTAAPDSFSEHVGMYSIRTDFQMKGSASQSPFYFIVKMMDRDEVGSLCRPERRPEKKKHVLCKWCWAQRYCSVETKQGRSQTAGTSQSTLLSQVSPYAVGPRLPLIQTKTLTSNKIKMPMLYTTLSTYV